MLTSRKGAVSKDDTIVTVEITTGPDPATANTTSSSTALRRLAKSSGGSTLQMDTADTLVWAVYCLCSKKRWKLEGSLFWAHKFKLLASIAMQFIHSTFTNIAYLRHVQGERLQDAGFDMLPLMDPSMRWINEFITFAIIAASIILAFLPFFHRKPPIYFASLWVRVLFVMAVCLVLRCLSFLATSLPGPAAHCQPQSDVYSPPETWYQILFEMNALSGCGDLVFSSHTTLVMALILSIHHYLYAFVSPRVYYATTCVFWPLFFVLVTMIVAARNHYTVDVIVALYTTPLVYHASYSVFPDDRPKEVRAAINDYREVATSESTV